jgi:hypothetical protein
VAWAARKKLTIAPLKSQLTLFTPWTKQVNTCPNVAIDSISLTLTKILGVTFDSLFCFAQHITAITAKAHQRLNLPRAVSGSLWGHDKETLLLTFRALVESVYSFAAAVWFPNTKPTNVNKLQLIQNAAMRLITGCHMVTSQDHLHAECKLLPVDEHLFMLCTQFLASCLHPSHPSNATVKLPPGHQKNQHGRPMKETLSSCFHDAVSPYLWGDLIPSGLYDKIKNDIHTATVQNYLTSAGPNKVLGTRPPAVDNSEKSLPQAYVTTLHQLRSSKCSALKTYQYFIKASNDDICQSCQSAPESTFHIFNCSTNPTPLTVLDLWRKPVEAAKFLSLYPSFYQFPPLSL